MGLYSAYRDSLRDGDYLLRRIRWYKASIPAILISRGLFKALTLPDFSDSPAERRLSIATKKGDRPMTRAD